MFTRGGGSSLSPPIGEVVPWPYTFHMNHLSALVVGTFGLSLTLTGCAASGESRRDLTPADFAITGQPADDAAAHDEVSQALEASSPSSSQTSQTAPPTAAPDSPDPETETATSPVVPHGAPISSPPASQNPAAPDPAHVMDAMIGQVNGRALYASTVLEPIHEQLGALGRTLPSGQFRVRARQLIGVTLEQLVADALILSEAERELDERQRMGLAMMVKNHREELLRQHGQGSLSLAEYHLLRDTGKTLDQTLQDFRNERVVQNYLRQRLLPKINVSRRDIERYYRDQYDQFNPKMTRVLRLIRVENETEAKQIAEQLAAGTPFEQVAGDKLNLYRPEAGGLMDPIVGDEPFSEPALNQALTTLKPGEHAGPFDMGRMKAFAYLESVEAPETKSLRDVQIQIDRLLREQQFQRLSTEYRARLFQDGSYNPISQMTDDLLEIAMSRYAAQ